MVFCHTNFHGHPSVEGDIFFSFFPNSNSFGAFSHSKGFGAELLSDSLWFFGADPSWAAKRFRLERFCGSFTQVQPRFPPQVSPRFPQVSPSSLWSADGRSVLGRQKVLWKVPFTLVSQFPNSFYSFFAFVPNSVSFGVFSRSKGLWAKWRWGFFAANGFRLPKGSLKCSPNSFLHWSHSLLRFFLANGCCFRKSSVEGSANNSLHLSPKWLLLHKSFRQLCFTFISQSPPGVSQVA